MQCNILTRAEPKVSGKLEHFSLCTNLHDVIDGIASVESSKMHAVLSDSLVTYLVIIIIH